MTQNLVTAVTNDITVPLPPARAYELFTAGFDRWWPRGHKIGEAPMARAVLQERAGGRWYEIGEDGTEQDWGRVLVWEPPTRLVLVWSITMDWAYDPDLHTEVEANFTDLGDGSTRVVVEHRNLDRMGPSAENARIVFSSPNGWFGILRSYAAAVAD